MSQTRNEGEKKAGSGSVIPHHSQAVQSGRVSSANNKPFLPYVVVHLDLKGAPPKLSYLKSLLPSLRRHGANGLLIEYEDMFPYEGRLVNLSALNRYGKQELTNFLSHARDLGFEIIPLLQTFGHMEFALKLEEYANLRERSDYPDSICPSRAESKILLSEMIEQVICMGPRNTVVSTSSNSSSFIKIEVDPFFAFGNIQYPVVHTITQHGLQSNTQIIRIDHRSPPDPLINQTGMECNRPHGQVMDLHAAVSRVKYIHIGCDEVYGMNLCERCQQRKLSNAAIFTQHVLSVARGIKSRRPNTTVLIWDDMLRSIQPLELAKFKLRGQVEPVYWNYEPVLKHTHINLYKYHVNSDNIWVASAFKGADGRAAAVPNMTARYLNHFSWMKLVNGYRIDGTTKSYNFKGVILTGWSRYAHMEPLCELLPVSVSSLFLCLQVIKTFKTNTYSSTNGIHSEDFYYDYIFMNLRESLNCTAENNPGESSESRSSPPPMVTRSHRCVAGFLRRNRMSNGGGSM
ncbi:Hexosaminidase D [Eumeta japonica]|uniref:Hexosaminidase D n=1 Tax=Eumeta variegata TaxID=151549 RepID=A0A4C1V101_EUMVA|nr:Hexosaminidase D [Eumeta japonica]